MERSSLLEAQHLQEDMSYDEPDRRDMAALDADDTLPTSTQMSRQEDTIDTLSATDSPSAPCSLGSHLLPNSPSDGQLSVMSDGSFIHVEERASAGDAECHEGVETSQSPQEDTMPVDLTKPVVADNLAPEAETLDRPIEGMSEHAAETASEHAQAIEESDEACSLASASCHCLCRCTLAVCIYGGMVSCNGAWHRLADRN